MHVYCRTVYNKVTINMVWGKQFYVYETKCNSQIMEIVTAYQRSWISHIMQI